ncbi:LuxR family transcriptional regulator [Actinomadura rubrobrunea]|uniref:LuxR family transcriptional regulator n=1 Tax=Actinomadura rubrobrunea TaxID=115335 RepID=A0A9W6Q058_9ACTN|nr:helix-turn-helix transcriptional regulator [Actinomadura rubrobrunea]GLW66148.1 LuxR family transcriptional regulator [Actinomadura rubrobrunea]
MAEDRREDVLIGRRAELAALTAALDRAAAESAATVLVSGDAGIGKTHLVTALAGIARERGCAVLVGQCAELGESMPYLPLADALWRGVRDPRQGEAVRAALESRPVLRRLLPDGDGGRGDASELDQQRLFGAALGLLGELGSTRPVLLVLEDLHWADTSTRHLLTFLSRVLQRERVCLVGTYRSDDLHRRHPMRPVIAELLRVPDVSAVELRPFAPDETAEYLAALSEGEDLSPELAERVHARSEGNPFYAAELYAAAATGEDLPAGLADLLLARLERLGDDAQRVVRAAAVAGRRVGDELVRRVSGLEEAAVGAALREVVSHRQLLPDGDGYVFRHALLREAVYADLLPGERTRLHAAFAALLADRSGPAAELAYHSLAAHDLPVAFAASVRAGREAERMGAPAEALEHYDRALSLWEAVPDPETASGCTRVDLALAAVRACGRCGEVRRAISRLRRLLEAADPGDVRLGALLREQLAYYLGDLDMNAEAADIAREAVDMLPADPPTPERAAALATYVRSLLPRVHGGPMERRHGDDLPALAEEAVAAARAAGAADAEASALVTLGVYREEREAGLETRDLFARARDLAVDAGNFAVALRAAFHHARAVFDRGDLAGAAEVAEQAVRFTLDNGLGWSTYGVNLRFLRYLIHYTAGEWEHAARLAADFGIRVARPAEAQVSAYALFLEVAQGSDAAAERLRWIEPLWGQDDLLTYISRGLAAERALWNGDPDAALDHVTAVLDVLAPGDASAIRIAATGLWAHADLGSSSGAADDLLARARTAASTTLDGLPRAWLGVEGHAWLARAEAEHARARGANDPELWRRTVTAFEYGAPGGGFVYEVARSRWRLAEALAEKGDRDEAAAQWRRGVAAAERLGARPLLHALRDLGVRARLAAASAAAAAGPLGALTAREREVLRLVAEGRNNRQIAEALFISPKTASVHVSNILAKLGVASRTQAAAVAHREGLVTR